MKYLSEKLKKEFLHNFTGIKIHNAVLVESIRGEHFINFSYYKDKTDYFFEFKDNYTTYIGFAFFTTKKSALNFIKKVNN